jgi:hypothetical protein
MVAAVDGLSLVMVLTVMPGKVPEEVEAVLQTVVKERMEVMEREALPGWEETVTAR